MVSNLLLVAVAFVCLLRNGVSAFSCYDCITTTTPSCERGGSGYCSGVSCEAFHGEYNGVHLVFRQCGTVASRTGCWSNTYVLNGDTYSGTVCRCLSNYCNNIDYSSAPSYRNSSSKNLISSFVLLSAIAAFVAIYI